MQGAGGIGGLLAFSDLKSSISNPSHYFYQADGNGHVAMLINSLQLPAAKYLCDPFGSLISMSGPLAEANPYRFSTKEYHANSGLYEFGRRYYDPGFQRWLNRDPIGERSDANMYAFVGNAPLRSVDPFGLADQLVSVSFDLNGRNASAVYVNDKF